MAYIETHQSLLSHRKTLRLARLLSIDRYSAAGRLMALWCWGIDNAQSGMIAKVDSDILADVMGWDGQPADLCQALVSSGFLDEHQDSYEIHDWMDYAGRLIEKRKSDAERKRAERTRNGQPTPVQRTSIGHPRDGAGTVPYPTVPDLTIPKREEDPSSPLHEADDSDHDVVTDASASSRGDDFFSEDDDMSFLDEEREPETMPARTQAQPANITALPVTTAPVATPPPKRPPKERTTWADESEPMRLACYLKAKLLAVNPDVRVPKDLTSWCSDFDKALRIDKRTYDGLKQVIDFATTDSFWSTNILSAGKLRIQYAQLAGKMRSQQQRNGENYHNGATGQHYAATGTEGQSSGHHGGYAGAGATLRGTPQARGGSTLRQPDPFNDGIYASLVKRGGEKRPAGGDSTLTSQRQEAPGG